MSRLFGRTLREAPADAEHESHMLMLRARLIEQLAAGIYSYLPLGYRVLRKVEQILREEMDRAGGQEILMPAMQPVDLWEESGRKASMGETLFTLTDRRERHLALGPTHEEVVVDLFRRNVQSYRELPQLLYQIQTKFRDEQRPRMGLVRGREFGMMDLYSFDADVAGLDRSYDAMYHAYQRVFERCGVPATVVQADSGAIGGKDSQEFMLLTDIGEDEILVCPNCGYAANQEKAEHKKRELPAETPKALEEVSTPGQKTIDDLAKFLGVEASQTLKAVFYMADRKPVFVAIRGDLEVNEIKLKNALKATDLRLMADDEVREFGLVAGSASPVGVERIRIVTDDTSPASPNLVGGANKPDVHLRNVNYGRDWRADVVTDIALARRGDPCPQCGMALDTRRGIEMGHIFKLLTVYSDKMGADYLDADGKKQTAVMGCYGIGTSRLLQCVVEANRDERGIVWPASVAPYDVHLVGLGLDRAEIAEKAERLYDDLAQSGLEVLFDDRTESPGVKFNDADLLGLPVRVTVSPRSLEKDSVEVKLRAGGDVELVPYAGASEQIRTLAANAR
ncbi:MAG TPA: proline--tRNA ligase [Dehalococcoidia bacterium]|jgi:prolyl-tRNA synthetase